MKIELKELKDKIQELDDFQKLYLLGFLQGQLINVKGFEEGEE